MQKSHRCEAPQKSLTFWGRLKVMGFLHVTVYKAAYIQR